MEVEVPEAEILEVPDVPGPDVEVPEDPEVPDVPGPVSAPFCTCRDTASSLEPAGSALLASEMAASRGRDQERTSWNSMGKELLLELGDELRVTDSSSLLVCGGCKIGR